MPMQPFWRVVQRSKHLIRRGQWLVVLLCGLLLLGLAGVASAQDVTGARVLVVEVRGVIDPIVARYVERSLAVADNAPNHSVALVVILLDTPGGLDSAMRTIVQAILNAETPVAVFVEPAGARAASAGVFITMAAHLAAMAPSTNLGAAHPVDLGNQGEMPATMQDKLTNDAVAYLQAIAQQRGRNADWAEAAVRQSASLTAQQALERHVVDLLATDLTDLLTQLDGRTVTTQVQGAPRTVTLALTTVPVESHPMTWLEAIAHALVDPNIAYLLLTLGTIALIAEFYTPGTFVPGVIGVICLILAFIALGNLPVNWGGMALIGLAFVLFLLDLKVTGFALSIAGAVSFVLGSLFLFSPFAPATPTLPRLTVSPWVWGSMTVLLVTFFVFAVTAGLRAQRQPALLNQQRLVGATGVALSDLTPRGVVQVKSEMWSATAPDAPVHAGESVEVTGSDGLALFVRRSGLGCG